MNDHTINRLHKHKWWLKASLPFVLYRCCFLFCHLTLKKRPPTIHFLAYCQLQKAQERLHSGEGDTISQSQKVIMSSFCPWSMSSLWLNWKCRDAEGQSLWCISTQRQRFNTGCSPAKKNTGVFPFAVFFLFNIVTCRSSSVLFLYIPLSVTLSALYVSKISLCFSLVSAPQTVT